MVSKRAEPYFVQSSRGANVRNAPIVISVTLDKRFMNLARAVPAIFEFFLIRPIRQSYFILTFRHRMKIKTAKFSQGPSRI